MNYECSICLEKYKKGDLVKDLECMHLFHESCILRWAETVSLTSVNYENFIKCLIEVKIVI